MYGVFVRPRSAYKFAPYGASSTDRQPRANQLRLDRRVQFCGSWFALLLFVCCSPIALNAQSALTSPAPGGKLSGSSATFSWSTGSGVEAYQFYLGTTGVGSDNLYDSGHIAVNSVAVTGLPIYGQKVYARLSSDVGGIWKSVDYTYTASGTPVLAKLSTPVPATKLSGSSLTFTWTAGAGVEAYQLFLGSMGVGSDNLYNSGHTTATSASVTGLPAYGQKIYARLYSEVGGIWESVDYTYTASGSPVLAVLETPAPGGVLSGSSATFTWTAGGGVTEYGLFLGTTGTGSHDLFSSSSLTDTSVGVTDLPIDGVKIYARLFSAVAGVWQSIDYTYTASGSSVAASLSSPTPGSTLPGASVTFKWTAGSAVESYQLCLGTAGFGSTNLYDSGHTTATSAILTNLPVKGAKVYARLYSDINGTWQSIDYTYTEALVSAPATLSSPAPGSALSSSGATFKWTSGVQVESYELVLGTSGVGSDNLYASGHTAATTENVTGLPTYGQKIYARLFSEIAGVWQSVDYTFTEGGSPVPATLSAPSPGGVLPGSGLTFAWTAGGGVAAYKLFLGTTGAGSNNLYSSGNTTATSVGVTGLPTNGGKIYARLYSEISGAWQSVDYTYTEAVPALLSAFSCTNVSMTGSGTDACTVTLNAAAPSGGLTVSLSSSNAAAAVPASVLVPANATSAGFTTTVSSLAIAQAVTLTAAEGAVSKTFGLQLNADKPTISVASSGSPTTYGGAVKFTATISNGPTGTVTFYSGGVSIGAGAISGTTATFTTSSLTAGSHTITAGWLGNSGYGAVASVAVTQVVNKATPMITWNTPAAINYGTALSSTQLDATSAIPGTLVYSATAGTVPAAGSQSLSVTLTPTDTSDYNTVTDSVTLTVNKATPTITWSTPAAIPYGTALSAAQLDATASVAGTFAYTPAAGTVPSTGSQTLSVTFTPTNATDYNTATDSVTLPVNQVISILSINATGIGFGNVTLNQPATQTLTLSSTGTGSVTVKSALLVGIGYTLTAPTFPTTLAPGQSVTLGIQFDPSILGAAAGVLTISSTSSSNGVALVSLSGSGAAATSYAVDLSWDAPTETADPVVGYNILRSSGGSNYQLLNSSVDTLTTYVDSTVQSGAAYDYVIESVDGSGNVSTPSRVVPVTIP